MSGMDLKKQVGKLLDHHVKPMLKFGGGSIIMWGCTKTNEWGW